MAPLSRAQFSGSGTRDLHRRSTAIFKQLKHPQLVVCPLSLLPSMRVCASSFACPSSATSRSSTATRLQAFVRPFSEPDPQSPSAVSPRLSTRLSDPSRLLGPRAYSLERCSKIQAIRPNGLCALPTPVDRFVSSRQAGMYLSVRGCLS